MRRIKRLSLLAASLTLVLLLAGCSRDPQPIHYGSDQCEHCRMVITEPAFASQLVTANGKAYSFDAIECMAAHLTEHDQWNQEEVTRWVHDFAHPKEWINAKEALFVQSRDIQSPMGLSLVAFSHPKDVKSHLQKYGGQQVSWSKIADMVRDRW